MVQYSASQPLIGLRQPLVGSVRQQFLQPSPSPPSDLVEVDSIGSSPEAQAGEGRRMRDDGLNTNQ